MPSSNVSILRRTAAVGAAAGALTALPLIAASAAHAQTQAPAINTVALKMTGTMSFKFDKGFVKAVKAAKATLTAKAGATYSTKLRTAVLPIDTTSTITVSPPAADIVAKGTVMIRRKDGRKAAATDIGLRLRNSGADLSGSVRGKPGREFAALTASATINVQQTDAGYEFDNVLMLVSSDMAKAAKAAHIKGITVGQIMGLMTAQVSANIPNFNLPGLGNLIPGLGGSGSGTGSTGLGG